MHDPLVRRIGLLEQALDRLEEALARAEDPIVRDACIQRFEFTFEMAWRAIQRYALSEGLECVSPRDCFRTGFQLGLIDKDGRWMAMVEDRNRTSHTYDEASAREIYRALPGYAQLLRRLLERLRQRPASDTAEARS
ncbi:MAG: nucleotidyltransferase substrate binding protein [Candidatus Rokubacteria bacterium]|nr:nucleotidyltransferase substrate binding protein [Candidatus Rokubacteria bacterium]